MDLNEKPTNLLESKLDHEIARCDSGQFKKLSQDDGGNLVAMGIDVLVKMEGSYSEHKAHEKDNQFLRNKLSELEREVDVLRERYEELQLRVASVEKVREVNSEAKEAVLERSRKSLLNNEMVESEEETVVQLMTEISVLQCEKQSAEREVDVWKQKCKELESRLWALQGRSCFGGKHELVNDGHMSAAVNNVIQDGGICYLTTPDRPVDLKQGIEVINLDEDEQDESSKPSKKQLFCGDDETNSEKTSLCTPARARQGATFADDISNADLLPSGYQGYSVLTPFASKEAVPYSKASSMIGEGDDDMRDCNEKFSFVATPKRKRSINIVTSDTESDDDDDNIPIGQFMRKHFQQRVPQPVVSESDDDSDLPTSGYQGYSVLTPFASKEAVPYSKASSMMGEGDDDMKDCNEKFSFVATPKRKRSINIVTSDTESDDDDDNIPIGQFVRKHFQQRVPQPVVSESDDDSDLPTCRRHRLIKLSQYEGRKKTLKTDESENDDDENSLGSFIDSSSDGSDSSESSDESSGEAEYFSDDNSDDYHGILHRIKRTKDLGSEWELEGDMLAAFGKDPVLCMKAVCALYRQQTSDEQECHETFVLNRRGFSKFDAQRGTELAEFLTDKIPNGDVTKSVEQLNEFDPDGLEKCRALATRYSKQLFEIYQNEEDPHFFPP